MTNCPDDAPDTEPGTFEHDIERFRRLEQLLQDEVTDNRDQRREAEDPPPELRHFRISDREYNPEAYLVVPHFSADEQRPIMRRPIAAPPLRSEGVTIVDDGGNETARIAADATYTIECTIVNHGGLTADNVHVELFVEHRSADASIDVNPETTELDVRKSPDAETTLSGSTTLPPESELILSGHLGDGDDDDLSDLLYRAVVPVGEDRTFETTIPGKPDSVPDDVDEFVISVRGRIRIPGQALRMFDDIHTVSARYINEPNNEKQRLDLSTRFEQPGVELIEKQHVSALSSEEVTATFEYEPEQSFSADRVLTVFYVRAYSLAPSDTPNDWGMLDHTTSRFMGRTEAEWRG